MNHDLKIFPGDAHVLRFDSGSFIGFVGQSEAISGIEWPIVVKRSLLDVFLARQHQFCTTTLRRMRSESPRRYMELSACFLDPRRPISISLRRRHEILRE